MAKNNAFKDANMTQAQNTAVNGDVKTISEKGKDRKGQQDTASPEEQQERASQLRTQGRKGCKAKRVNLLVTPENYEFITVMAGVRGESMARYINAIIETYRADHPEIYEKAQEIKRLEAELQNNDKIK